MAGIGFQLNHACLSYEGRQLFDQLSLHVAAGEWLTIVGESGVGKSTLLRLVAGLDCGTEASAQVRADDDRELASRLAWMAQDDLLLPWLSVADNVCLGDRLRKVLPSESQRAKVAELLARVGLAQSAELKPAQLSGGMRQRVALARTLYEARPLVLMDEPFSALDAITRLQLQELAAELLAAHTVVLITHDPLEALRLGDRVLVLAGRPAQLVEVAAPEGHRPRDLSDRNLLAQQAELLERLAHHRLEPS